MKIKPIPFKYAQRGSRLYLTNEQTAASSEAKPGKVLGGCKIGKSELRAIAWGREEIRLKKVMNERKSAFFGL